MILAHLLPLPPDLSPSQHPAAAPVGQVGLRRRAAVTVATRITCAHCTHAAKGDLSTFLNIKAGRGGKRSDGEAGSLPPAHPPARSPGLGRNLRRQPYRRPLHSSYFRHTRRRTARPRPPPPLCHTRAGMTATPTPSTPSTPSAAAEREVAGPANATSDCVLSSFSDHRPKKRRRKKVSDNNIIIVIIQ